MDPDTTVPSSLRNAGSLFRKVEHVEEISDCGHVSRNVRIAVVHRGIRKVVAAPSAERAEAPVALDELHERRMFRVAVRDVAARREWRNGDHRDTRTSAEEVNRLDHRTNCLIVLRTMPLARGLYQARQAPYISAASSWVIFMCGRNITVHRLSTNILLRFCIVCGSCCFAPNVCSVVPWRKTAPPDAQNRDGRRQRGAVHGPRSRLF